MFTKLLTLAVVLFTVPAKAGGFNFPQKFTETHEIVTPAEADEARVVEVMLTHSEELKESRDSIRIESIHLHADHASVYLSTDGGDSYGTWLVDMEGRW